MSGTKSAQLLKTLGDEAWKRSEKIVSSLKFIRFLMILECWTIQFHVRKSGSADRKGLRRPHICESAAGKDVLPHSIELCIWVCSGFSMGTRLIEDFLSKSGIADLGSKCVEMKECAEVLSKVQFHVAKCLLYFSRLHSKCSSISSPQWVIGARMAQSFPCYAMKP